MAERGVFVDHATVHRWALKIVPALVTVFRGRKRSVGKSWRMDETSYEGRFVTFSSGLHRPVSLRVDVREAEVELRAARVALANLVSGGRVSAPRSHVRVGGAPKRAAPLYDLGGVKQPTAITCRAAISKLLRRNWQEFLLQPKTRPGSLATRSGSTTSSAALSDRFLAKVLAQV